MTVWLVHRVVHDFEENNNNSKTKILKAFQKVKVKISINKWIHDFLFFDSLKEKSRKI